MNAKQMRTKVYLPLYLKDKGFIRYKNLGHVEFVKIEVGDVFFIDKLPSLDSELSKAPSFKVAEIYYSTFDRGNLVILEPKYFTSEKSLERF